MAPRKRAGRPSSRSVEEEPSREEEDEETILYELLVYSEWKQEQEVLGKPAPVALPPVSRWSGLIGAGQDVPEELAQLAAQRLTWRFAAGVGGRVVAVLQDAALEIRSSRDEYSSIVGKASLARDPFPQWRRMAWTQDGSLLACAGSNGEVGIYDLLASNVLTVRTGPADRKKHVGVQDALAGLAFVEARNKNARWPLELLTLRYDGKLQCYQVSPTDGHHLSHSVSLRSRHPSGVTCMAADPYRRLLYTAGDSDWDWGLCAWRLLSDYPYFKEAPTSGHSGPVDNQPGWFQRWFSTPKKKEPIFHMALSPDGTRLISLHVTGAISVWEVPSLRLRRYWDLDTQPDADRMAPGLRKEPELARNPVDAEWWSDSALVIARASGNVTVCSAGTLLNLLGESPEFFGGAPQVSPPCEKGFLALECETHVTTKKKRAGLPDAESSESDSDSETEDTRTLAAKGASVAKTALYWVTDSDMFRPPRKRPRLVRRTYRLLGLKSTTPEELYARKIDAEEYGEALALAKAYGLDCDLVYQRQWRNSPVSYASICDYLSKITKRSWVLSVCMERVPVDIEAARSLLEYGLQRTDIPELLGIDTDDDAEDRPVPDLSTLNPEQTQMVYHRRRFLAYLDILSTYEVILGGSHVARDHYDPSTYARLRSQPLLNTAMEFAHADDWRAVGIVLRYHAYEVAPHVLDILGNFPETTSPFEYRVLLPECGIDGEVFVWEAEEPREPDWCEQGSRTYWEELKDGLEKPPPLTPEVVSAWYVRRAYEIELQSRMVGNALELVKLGLEKNVAGLEHLRDELLTLETLVYECQVEELTLTKLEQMSSLETAKLLMSGTVSDTFVRNMRNRLLPYLFRCERDDPGSRSRILRDYLCWLSHSDLTVPLTAFRNSRPDDPEPVLESPIDLLSLALDCVYEYPYADQLENSTAILECLPERESSPQTPEIQELHDRVDSLEKHLRAAAILERNGVPKPLSYIRDAEYDPEEIEALFTQVTRTVGRREPSPNEQEWKQVLYDVLEMQQKVFSSVEPQTCYEVYVSSLLASSRKETVKLAGEMLERKQNAAGDQGNVYLQRVPYQRSVELVLAAAREYFDSAANAHDPCMELARTCLQLIGSPNAEVQEELDLINSVPVLNDFGIHILPLQVRLCSQRLELIRQALLSGNQAYRRSRQLLRLATLLHVCGDDERSREGAVLVLLAEAALEAGDHRECAKLCAQLSKSGYAPGWKVAARLGQSHSLSDIQARAELLDFALVHCDEDRLEEMVKARRVLEMECLCAQVSDRMELSGGVTTGREIESPDSDEGFSDALSSPVEDEKTEGFATPSGSFQVPLLEEARIVLHATSKTVLQTVSNRNFWRNTMGWLRPLRALTANSDDASHPRLNSDMQHQGLHAFFCSPSLQPLHSSALETTYERYSIPDPPSSCEFSTALFRLSILRATIATEHTTVDTSVLLQAAQDILPEDSALGLALLLALADPSLAASCFDSLPATSVTLHLATYFFALCLLPPETDIAKLTPQEVVHKAKHRLAGKELESVERKVANCFEQYQRLLADYTQAEMLQGLGRGVDVQRFATDDEYKRDTILGLAMTVEAEVYGMAVELANRYGLELWELQLAHLEALLLEDGVAVEDVQKRMKELKLVNTLRGKEEEVRKRLERVVYPSISGTDHTRLSLYYTILDALNPGSTSVHLSLLEKLSAISALVDYKKLSYGGKAEFADVIKPVITSDNVSALASLAESIPDGHVSSGMVYAAWAHKHFFNGACRNDSEWLKRFQSCKPYIQFMKEQDVHKFADSLCFSRESLDRLTVRCRSEILRRCESFDIADSIRDELKQWRSHLEQLDTEYVEKLRTGSMREYVCEFDLSRGEESKVHALLVRIVLENQSLSTLQAIIALLPPEQVYSPEDVLMDALRMVIRTDASQLTTVLRALKEYLPDSELLSDTDITDELRPFYSDASVPVSARLAVLQTVQHFFPLDLEDEPLLRLYRTQAVIAPVWPDVDVKTDDLDAEDGRLELFQTVLERTESVKQAEVLATLLHDWPDFQGEEAWAGLVQKAVKLEGSKKMVVKLVQELQGEKQVMSEQCLSGILDTIDKQKDLDLYLQVALLSGYPQLYNRAVDHLRSNAVCTASPVVLSLLLRRGLASQLISSALYPVIVDHLLSMQPVPVDEVVQQLITAGFRAEAGTVAMASKGVPPGLRVFRAALGILKR